MTIININPEIGDAIEFASVEEFKQTVETLCKTAWDMDEDETAVFVGALSEGVDYEYYDGSEQVFLVNTDTLEVTEATRADVRSAFGCNWLCDWNDDELLQALDNASLIDFETREAAEKYVEENK